MARLEIELTDQLHDDLIKAIDAVIVIRQAVGLVDISHPTFYKWMKQGEEDIKNEIFDSQKAKLFAAVKKTQAKKISELVAKIKNDKAWQAHAWILERCFREDFGVHGGLIQELVAKCEKLEEAHKRLNENFISLQGVTHNG